MKHQSISIRPFLGAKNFDVSRRFYHDLGFEETVLSPAMSVFRANGIAFYLQDFYVKDWVENSMIFLEVENVEQHYNELIALDLPKKYETVKIIPIRNYEWGKEYFLYDPSGVLWHFGAFFKS